MTSAAKISANRANARASTGPKTAAGRRRSARNALRHGLSLPSYSDPALVKEIEALARDIVGPNAKPNIWQLARRVAEAQIDLRRIRAVRHRLLWGARNDASDQTRTATPQAERGLHRWLQTTADAPSVTEDACQSATQLPETFAAMLLQNSRQLRAIDRYERRALSRRKFAIRALDDARRYAASPALPGRPLAKGRAD